MLLDQAAFAPTEVKSEILAILVAEGSLSRKTKTATFFGELVISIARLFIGNKKVKNIFHSYFLKNPQIAENDFALLISVIVNTEPLSLIQDFLYALHLTKWEFEADYMKTYIDSIIKNTLGHDEHPTEPI